MGACGSVAPSPDALHAPPSDRRHGVIDGRRRDVIAPFTRTDYSVTAVCRVARHRRVSNCRSVDDGVTSLTSSDVFEGPGLVLVSCILCGLTSITAGRAQPEHEQNMLNAT